MNYAHLQILNPRDVRRYCRVTPPVFKQIVKELKEELPKKGQRGRQPSFSVEDELLITLEYRREYRTYFHIAQNWQCSEATICRSVQRVEKILSESQKFHLPGKNG